MLLELAVGKKGAFQEQVCLNCRFSNNCGSSARILTSNMETQVQAKRYPWCQLQAQILEETLESKGF